MLLYLIVLCAFVGYCNCLENLLVCLVVQLVVWLVGSVNGRFFFCARDTVTLVDGLISLAVS